MKSTPFGNADLHALDVAMRFTMTGAVRRIARLGSGPTRPVSSLLAALLAFHACTRDAPLEPRLTECEPEHASVSAEEQGESGTFPKPGAFQVSASGKTGAGGAADDPAIWVHPSDRSLSLVIGADKGGSGGLRVYTLDGAQIQFVQDGEHDNVDVRYGFALGGATVDLVSVSNRSNNHIDVYRVDATERRLIKVGSVPTGITVYGYAMYHSRATGELYGFVNSGSGEVEQYRLKDQGGTVVGERVRTFDVGGQLEGMVADDELGHIYIGEEARGIWKYGAEPGAGTVGTLVDHTGAGGHLTADVEGLAIYYRRDGKGYLISSSQGADQFVIHRREGDNNYLATFTIPAGATDEVTATDGIDVTNVSLGDAFPLGLFAAHDDGGENYKLVPWEKIANTIGLAIDTQGYDPRGADRCTEVSSVEVSPANASVSEGTTIRLTAASPSRSPTPRLQPMGLRAGAGTSTANTQAARTSAAIETSSTTYEAPGTYTVSAHGGGTGS